MFSTSKLDHQFTEFKVSLSIFVNKGNPSNDSRSLTDTSCQMYVAGLNGCVVYSMRDNKEGEICVLFDY